MRHVAAIPAAGLLSGAVFGIAIAGLPRDPAALFLILCVALALWAWQSANRRLLAAVAAAAFFVGGALLASDAWERAWRPPLRIVFEALARDERAAAEAQGRRLPEDDEAFAIVQGTLRMDAAASESGVSLSIDVDTVERRATPSGERPLVDARLTPSRSSVVENAPVERPATGGIIVTVVGALAADRMEAWRAGRHVRVPVQLHRAARYLDPGVPDHERALARRGTTLVGTVKSGALVEVTARGSGFDEAMSVARAVSRRAIADAVGRWSARSAAIVAAIVIGDRAGLDVDIQRRLQEAGTYHVIAISGGNIAILAGLLIGGFRIAGWLGRTAMIASVAALLAYAQFVGNGASVDRATVMAVVYFGARAIDHRSPPLNALAVTAALLVVSDPLAVVDPAFVLTFGATLAILVVVPVVASGLAGRAGRAGQAGQAGRAGRAGQGASTSRVDRARGCVASAITAVPAMLAAFKRTAIAMFAASAAAEALLFPVGAIVFSRVTFAGLALNFLAIPLMGLAQIAGMAVVPIAIVSTRASAAVGFIAHLGAAGLIQSADLLRFAPFLSYRLAPPSAIVVAIYYVAVAAWWTLWRHRRDVTGSAESDPARVVRYVAAACAVIAALWILVDPHTLLAARGDGRLHVTVLDVGQGDAIFIVFPRGSTLLVDAGGLPSGSAFDVGDRVVAPVIRAAGFRRLDYVALTHGDPDHVGGAPAIVGEFRPREVWEGIPVPRSAPLTQLRALAQAGGARWANVYAGDHATIDDVDVIAKHPWAAEWERQKVRNDDSLVLELRWRDLSVVLTGDAGKAVERELAATFPPARIRIVKVPHHGSLTSSTPDFLAALHPQVAIASAGRTNHFGHPVPEVLDRYRSAGAEVFRTDQDGAVTVDSDGYSVAVHTFVPRRPSPH